MHEMLYEELRQTEQEILHSLKKKDYNKKLTSILEEELSDIRLALKKVKAGNFGLCEVSGEMIPANLIKSIPTIKSCNDVSKLQHYYRKPIHFHN